MMLECCNNFHLYDAKLNITFKFLTDDYDVLSEQLNNPTIDGLEIRHVYLPQYPSGHF